MSEKISTLNNKINEVEEELNAIKKRLNSKQLDNNVELILFERLLTLEKTLCTLHEKELLLLQQQSNTHTHIHTYTIKAY